MRGTSTTGRQRLGWPIQPEGTNMKAAVFHAPHQPLTIEDVEIEKPKRREILLRTAFAGLCHSDLHFMEGLYPIPAPCVLGHEGAAVVEAVGEDVTYVKPGDHVITCLSVFCGECPQCLTGHANLCENTEVKLLPGACLLYTSDAADDLLCVDLGGRRII